MSIKDQPLSHLQWVSRDDLRANNWNPNRVAPPELRLLKLSIVESGWTQPVVAQPDGEIVDGFHRWTVSAAPEIARLTGGLVPVVPLVGDAAHLRAATVRHNRARGTHHVLKMADIVTELSEELGMPADEIGRRLGMDDEEVDRLMDRGVMTKRGAAPDGQMGNGWIT